MIVHYLIGTSCLMEAKGMAGKTQAETIIEDLRRDAIGHFREARDKEPFFAKAFSEEGVAAVGLFRSARDRGDMDEAERWLHRGIELTELAAEHAFDARLRGVFENNLATYFVECSKLQTNRSALQKAEEHVKAALRLWGDASVYVTAAEVIAATATEANKANMSELAKRRLVDSAISYYRRAAEMGYPFPTTKENFEADGFDLKGLGHVDPTYQPKLLQAIGIGN